MGVTTLKHQQSLYNRNKDKITTDPQHPYYVPHELYNLDIKYAKVQGVMYGIIGATVFWAILIWIRG